MLLEVPSPDISSELSFLLGMPAEASWLAQAADFCSLRSPEGTSALLARDPTGLQADASTSQAEIRQEAMCQGSSNGNSCPAAGGGDVNDMQPSPASAAVPPPPPPPPAPHVEYKQSTGETSVKIGSLTILPLGTGYAGHGQGLNNPGSQSVGEADDKANAGPVPQGGWTIGPAVNNHLGSPAMPLQPNPGTQTFGRRDFWIHADNPARPPLSSSEGCIVLPRREDRLAIAGSGIDSLEVVQ